MIGVQGLMPPGPAFHAVNIEGTVQYQYWRAFSNVLGYTYSRLCDYVDEFFCATVNESRDQWIEEYGLNDVCDPYGYNLCLKVGAAGGATCDYFVQMAALSGYVITCAALDDPEPIAGCFEVGCTGLGPTPVFSAYGGTENYGEIGTCFYGEVVQHPDPTMWENGKTAGSVCTVPGSNLGQGPDTDESCCFICGWYEVSQPVVETAPNYCLPGSYVINFDCPRRGVEHDPSPGAQPRAVLRGLDSNGNYSEWGQAYVWEVTVDSAASRALQATNAPPPPSDPPKTSQAGDFMVGGSIGLPDGSGACGTPLCADTTADPYQPHFVLCFLDRIKPAHTVLNVKVV
jgi:hypothetical protein